MCTPDPLSQVSQLIAASPSLIDTATIAFASPPKITRYAPHQPDSATAIANVVLELPGVVDSVEISSGEKRVLEWGGPEPGMRIKSRETWHDPA